MEIRHAIVGCGVIGPHHATSIAELDGSRLTVVCDPVAERAEKLAGQYPGVAVVSTLQAVLDRDEAGNLVRKAGVMAIILSGGEVRPGDPIRVELPPVPHRPLEPV